MACRAAAYGAQRNANADYVEAALNRSGSLQQLQGSVDHDMHDMEEQQRQLQLQQQQQDRQQMQQQPQQQQQQQPQQQQQQMAMQQQGCYGPAQPTSLGEHSLEHAVAVVILKRD